MECLFEVTLPLRKYRGIEYCKIGIEQVSKFLDIDEIKNKISNTIKLVWVGRQIRFCLKTVVKEM